MASGGLDGDDPALLYGRLVTLRFIPRDEMEAQGYGAYLDQVEDI